jgi:hypothetical protein
MTASGSDGILPFWPLARLIDDKKFAIYDEKTKKWDTEAVDNTTDTQASARQRLRSGLCKVALGTQTCFTT